MEPEFFISDQRLGNASADGLGTTVWCSQVLEQYNPKELSVMVAMFYTSKVQ